MTNFENPRKKTDKTDKTDIQSNHDFMRGIFGDDLKEYLPVWSSLMGNPKNGKWSGIGWQKDVPDLRHDYNNYTTLATYRQNDEGEYRRQKKYFHALYAFMLDDLGTKIPMERLTLPPSWLIETSAGNYQVGYILDVPLKDAKLAENILEAIINAGLCDAGAKGALNRLVRLPFAINGKKEPAFVCKLEQWNPELRYSVDDLINKLNLDMDSVNKGKAKPSRPDGHDEIFFECPTENPVLLSLNSKGLYKKPLGNGVHDITCPWVNEHTDQADGGTAYFEPDDNHPIGGFNCFHAHCTDRKIREFLEYLEIEAKNASMKATIKCIAGEIHRISDRAEHVLAKQSGFYQRGGFIVTISNDPITRDIFVKNISKPALLSSLSAAALWERYDKRSDRCVRIDPPQKVVNIVFDAPSFKYLPALNGLVHQPYFRPDRSIKSEAGYDGDTGFFGVFDTNHFDIPECPSKADAEKSLSVIEELLAEFSFAKQNDKAAALSAILTAAIRPSIIAAPMFHVRAPQISSGKSYLCELITAFATPRRGTPTAFPYDDEECRKLLLAELLRAPPVIEFDNLTSDIFPHKSLCTALTSEFMTGRILGESRTATVSTRTLFLSSGNNVSPIKDMTRRCITINLDPKCETPAARVFKNPNLLKQVQENRGAYVSAALTIILAWIKAGQPISECIQVANYLDWSDLCRQPLLWLGLDDPAVSIFEAMNDDPDQELLGRLLHAWYKEFGTTPRMVRDAVNRVNILSKDHELSEILFEIASDKNMINRKILGHWIKRNQNRIVDGMRFVCATGNRSAKAYRVEFVS